MRLIVNRALLVLLGLCAVATSSAQGAEEDLYYLSRATFDQANAELQLSGGYDFSNPYIWIYSGSATAYWLESPVWAVGMEISKFGSYDRQTFKALQEAFSADIGVIRPSWAVAAVGRLTPLSGMVNLFSKSILMVDVGLVGRFGIIRYEQIDAGAMLGCGLEIGIGVTQSWGVHLNVDWNADRPSGLPWESRVGFRMGPVFRL